MEVTAIIFHSRELQCGSKNVHQRYGLVKTIGDWWTVRLDDPVDCFQPW